MNDWLIEKPGIETVKNYLQENLKEYIPFFVSLSGAHVYGFASPDSDIDLRGAFLYNKENLMGFWDYKNLTFERHNDKLDGIEIDLVFHELNKYINMVITGENGYVLEQIFSPVIIHKTDEFSFFQETVKKYYISKRLYKHYSGFAYNKIQEFKIQEQKSVKTLLYALRVLHTAIYLFKSSDIIINLKDLNSRLYNLQYIGELIERKVQEQSLLAEGDDINFYESELARLYEIFENTYNESNLPENVRNRHKLTTYTATIYSQYHLDKPFIRSVMLTHEDAGFVTRSREKLLLASSPFYVIERALDLKISPQKIVFTPDLDRYFLIKQEKPRGKYYEFIDIELFLRQLKKNNPFCLMALYNPEPEKVSPYMDELVQRSDKVITKSIYKSFMSVARTLYEKIKDLPGPDYEPRQVILMIAMLITASKALRTGLFEYDYTPYLSMFTAIKNQEISITQLTELYKELATGLEQSYITSSLNEEGPDQELLLYMVQMIKQMFWV